MSIRAFEIRFALALLKYLRANVNNAYLIRAIVAWTRAESGVNWEGNNPLRIGHGQRFSSITAAAQATARKLIAGAQYRPMLRRIREAPQGDQQQGAQAYDFLMLLATSDWDARHYGMMRLAPARPGQKKKWVFDPNGQPSALLNVWNKLLDMPFTIPGDPIKPPKQPKPPRQPKVQELPTTLHHEYIDPYQALHFYEARHEIIPPVPGSPLSVPS